jgi:hypothetical protein
MTAGIATAANWPSPYTSSNVAIVYGTGTGADDMAAANTIATDLGAVGQTTVTGGQSFLLDKTSNHFNFNDTLNAVYSSIDKDEMTTFLADGNYDDGDVDNVDFEQSITLSSNTLHLFADTDYANKAPTVGFQWTNGQTILNYTMDFDEDVNYTQMVGTDMPLLGSTYYVLAASTTQVDLLDTAERQTWAVGQSGTVGGHSVTLTFVDSSSAKFTVGGESITVDEGSYKKIPGTDSYVAVTDVSYQDYASGIQTAEFSVGSGKIELIDGEEAELNNEDIDGLEVTLTDGASTSFLRTLTLTWKSDRDSFLTETNALTMPEFSQISLAFGGLNLPSSPETISIDNGDTLTLDMGNYALPITWLDTTVETEQQNLGEEDNLLKLAGDTNFTWLEAGFGNASTLWWSGDTVFTTAGTGDVNAAGTASDNTVGNLSENQRFLVTRLDDDLTEVEQLYYEVSTIDIDDADTWTVELEDLIGSDDLTFTDSINDTDDHGDVTVTVSAFASNNLSVVLDFSAPSGTITYNRAVSEKGLIATLPNNASGATNATGYVITFTQPDKDGEGGINLGVPFTITVVNTTNDRFHVSTHNLTSVDEEESNDVFIGYVPSDLATMFTFDTTADENDFSMTFYGEEVTADVSVVGGGSVSTDGGAIGNVLVTDSQVSTVSTKNLVVVGGSCVNSAAATLLGVSPRTCTSAWTAAAGVGSGQFTIRGFSSSQQSLTSGVALLVAGYEKADTANAATALTTQTIDTSKTYTGTSGQAAVTQISSA